MANFYKKFQERLLLPKIDFADMAFTAFRHQAKHNSIYQLYLSSLGVEPAKVTSMAKIPYLPIEFFKSHKVLCQGIEPISVFRSSGTTGQANSQHFVESLSFYYKLSEQLFEEAYGSLQSYTFLALLPSYLERKDASLVYMIDNFIQKGGKNSGFYLNDLQALTEKISTLNETDGKLMLIGVTFALLDLLEKQPFSLKESIVAETGGMKGRRKEIVRAELHEILTKGFRVESIHSEYGMTELLSQCYSLGNGIFNMSKSLQICLREINDPFTSIQELGKAGGINVIDLGNIHSCCFIETKDIGKLVSKNQFEVLGRFDNSEIRGCNLMIS